MLALTCWHIIGLSASAGLAIAQQSEQVGCAAASDISVEQTLAVCSELIERGSTMSAYERAMAHYVRGLGYASKGDEQRAHDDFSAAIALRPDFAKAYRERGVIELNAHRFVPAISDFSQSIQLEPPYADALYDRGMAYLSTDNLKAADADFDRAEKLAGPLPGILYLRGVTLERLGYPDQALAAFGRVIQAKAPVLYELALGSQARLLLSRGGDRRAWEDIEICLREFPRFAECYDIRALLFEKAGEPARALADLDAAILLNPGAVSYIEHRAALRASLGDQIGAAEDSARARSLSSTGSP